MALAAGHRPCGLCRRQEYLSYRRAVTTAVGADKPVLAPELNRRLGSERLRPGRGIDRSVDRILTVGPVDSLVEIVTPPTSMLALTNGFAPVLHPSANGPGSRDSC